MIHPELKAIKSLSMLKMEKNFRAQDKGYVRMPPDSFDYLELYRWVLREMEELNYAIEIKDFTNIREEVADVGNCLDYLYESALREEIKQENAVSSGAVAEGTKL